MSPTTDELLLANLLQIVVLIVIGAVVMNVVKCLHDKFCVLCKKKDECCK